MNPTLPLICSMLLTGAACTDATPGATADAVADAPAEVAADDCVHEAPCETEGATCGEVELEHCWGSSATQCVDGQWEHFAWSQPAAPDCAMTDCELPLNLAIDAPLRLADDPAGCSTGALVEVAWFGSSHDGYYVSGRSGYTIGYHTHGDGLPEHPTEWETLSRLPLGEPIDMQLAKVGAGLFSLTFVMRQSGVEITALRSHR